MNVCGRVWYVHAWVREMWLISLQNSLQSRRQIVSSRTADQITLSQLVKYTASSISPVYWISSKNLMGIREPILDRFWITDKSFFIKWLVKKIHCIMADRWKTWNVCNYIIITTLLLSRREIFDMEFYRRVCLLHLFFR